jgi:hypothetical protein
VKFSRRGEPIRQLSRRRRRFGGGAGGANGRQMTERAGARRLLKYRDYDVVPEHSLRIRLNRISIQLYSSNKLNINHK